MWNSCGGRSACPRLLWALLGPCIVMASAPPPSTPWVIQARTYPAVPTPVINSIPQSYVGLSIEWEDIDSLTRNPAFYRMVKNVFTIKEGPEIVRIGGNSQDLLNTSVTPELWGRLATLVNMTGCQMVIGLNLLANNVSLAKEQVTNAIKFLGPASIYAFEIGNEPDRYQFVKFRPADYLSGQYTSEIQAYIDVLGPIWKEAFGTLRMLCGPSFSVALAWNQAQLRSYASQFKPYLKLMAAHKYITQSSNEKKATITSLTLNSVVAQYARDVDQMRANAIALHVSFVMNEMNSFSQGGKPNVSNTLAAALWGLDQALYFAQRGASGINLHGGKCAAYSPIAQCDLPASLDITVNPILYSLRMLQSVLSNMTSFVGNSAITSSSGPVSTDTVSFYVLTNGTSGETHVVIINKNELRQSITFQVQLSGRFTGGQGTFLIGPSLASQSATYAGVTIQNTGRFSGPLQASYPAAAWLVVDKISQGKVLSVQSLGSRSPVSQFTVLVPAGSAMLLTTYQR